ncbi:MAG: RNA polymerase sigma-70 factor [Paludibacter sp.]
MKISNQDLWKKIYENDDLNAFETLHNQYYAQLCNFVYSYLKERESCEEVVSDVFVAIWQKRKELTEIRNIQSYLYTCSKNLSIDLIRKNAIRIQPDTNLYEIDIPDIDENLLSPIEMKEFRGNIQKAIEQLPPQCKLIFKMLVNDELAYKEIAEILNLSRKTVEAQVAIAYKKITVLLKNIYIHSIFIIIFLML